MTDEPQKITKLAKAPEKYNRILELFPSGRTALKSILFDLNQSGPRVLLLPAYIGWSVREGSGVFDPVQELGIHFEFYKITSTLEIDQSHLSKQLAKFPNAILLLIHYFGRVDPGYRQILSLAKEFGAEIIEDEAHAMLTDLVGGASGRAGKFAFFSLHKLLPVRNGGTKIHNGGMLSLERAGIPLIQLYDLNSIAQARIRNYMEINIHVKSILNWVHPIWPILSAGEVPQTYPIRLKFAEYNRELRDKVYERMNTAGYGVVSLYHTLIDAIDPTNFPESHRVANSILNLPVHQDLDNSLLRSMVSQLATIIDDLT